MAEAHRDPALQLGLDDARARIIAIAQAHLLPHEQVDLRDAAWRVLADDVFAPHAVPPFANAAMDGFALRGADIPVAGEKRFELVAQVFAGDGPAAALPAGACVRITTGAALPPGADTVLIKEDARIDAGAVVIDAHTTRGAHVRAAGEDFRHGELALRRGLRLSPARLGVLASFGIARVAVVRRPRAVLLTTGNELVETGLPLGFGQIHDSNRPMLGALLETFGAELLRVERLRDEPALIADALRRATSDADLVVSSGGVSAGEADHLPQVFESLGRIHFWKVRVKPGMPFLFGQVGNALVFGLPGNPVSGLATAVALVKPALAALAGCSEPARTLHARLHDGFDKRHARAEMLRATLHCDDAGVLWAQPHARQGSAMLRGVVQSDALLLLAEGVRLYAPGDVVEAFALPGWPG